MLINKIRDDMIRARQGDDPVAKSLLVTLYSEVFMVGKNKRNGPTTDDEAVGVIRKFAANAEETQRLLADRGQAADAQVRELEILQDYLPRQMDCDQLAAAINTIVSGLPEKGAKAMGKVMAELKTRHGGTYDGKMASEMVKSALA